MRRNIAADLRNIITYELLSKASAAYERAAVDRPDAWVLDSSLRAAIIEILPDVIQAYERMREE